MQKIRLIMLLCLTLSVAAWAEETNAQENEPEQTAPEHATEQMGPMRPAMPQMQVSTPATADDVNIPWAGLTDDPNTTTELNEKWQEIERAAESESRQVVGEDNEESLRLVRASHKQAEAELELLKIIAMAEGATKTAATIDELIQKRRASLDEITERVMQERKEERMKEREERRKALEEHRRNRMHQRPDRQRPDRQRERP